LRLYHLGDDPGELNNLAADGRHAAVIETMQRYMLARFLTTHPEASRLPVERSVEEKIEWFLRPRDAAEG
jgi:hypothetical protein